MQTYRPKHLIAFCLIDLHIYNVQFGMWVSVKSGEKITNAPVHALYHAELCDYGCSTLHQAAGRTLAISHKHAVGLFNNISANSFDKLGWADDGFVARSPPVD